MTLSTALRREDDTSNLSWRSGAVSHVDGGGARRRRLVGLGFGRDPLRQRGKRSSERGTQRLVGAPVAEATRARPPVTGASGAVDRPPEGGELAFGGQEVGLVGFVTQHLA